MASDVSAQLDASMGDRSLVSPKDLGGLQKAAEGFLFLHPEAVGAGAIFSVAAIQDAEGVLEWWFRKDGEIAKMGFDLAPTGNAFYDYEQLPWFSEAARTGKQTIAGPYVDYLGFNEYIMTCTVPCHVRDTFVGVIGCDLRVRDLEEILIPIIRQIPGDAALVNGRTNRVILGNSGRFLVGERVRLPMPASSLITISVPNLNLSLLRA